MNDTPSFELVIQAEIDARIQAFSVDKSGLQSYVRQNASIVKEYKGRQVFEMLQNMDDQMVSAPENARTSQIVFDKDRATLFFRNQGEPFSSEGIKSIMMPNLSPKMVGRTIGNKGLGFRSLLNWEPEKVLIRSNGLELSFSSNTVREIVGSHPALQANASSLREGETLPILMFPAVQRMEENSSWSTEIELQNMPSSKLSDIETELQNFQSELLLFLPNLRAVEIQIISGGLTSTTAYLTDEWKVAPGSDNLVWSRGIKVDNSSIDNWIAFREEGQMDGVTQEDGNPSDYNLSIAVPLAPERREKLDHVLRNYLPVRSVDIRLPCLVHATVDLNPNRDALSPGNAANQKIFSEILPSAFIRFAEFLKKNSNTDAPFLDDKWFPWKLLSPEGKGGNEFVEFLYSRLREVAETEAFVPCVDDSYRSHGDSRFFAKTESRNDIVAFFNRHPPILPNHVLSDQRSPLPESFGDHPCKPGELERAINGAVASTNLSDEELAELIHVLWRIRQSAGGTGTFNVLRDSDNRFPGAGERMYTPVGESKMKIPDFMSLGFLSDSLWTAVQNRFSYELDQWRKQDSRNWLRSFCRNDLSTVVGIVWYDKTAVTRQMVSACRERLRLVTNQSEKRTLVKQLLEALYQNYDPGDEWNPEDDQESDEVPDSGESASRRLEYPIDVDADGEVRNAGEFLFESAKVFYDGALPEDIFLSNERARSLLGVSDGDDARIKAFFRSLGVRDDVRVKYLELAKPTDDDYLNFLKDSGSLPSPSGNPLPPRQLFPKLRDAEFIRNLSIEHLLGLLTIPGRNGFADLLIEKPVVQWKEEWKKYPRPFPVDWSYCAFQLKDSQNSFVIDENRNTIESLERRLQGTTRSPECIVDILITKMGARRTLKDLSLEELYGRLEKFDDCSGVQGFYQQVRMVIKARIDACDTAEKKTRMLAECEQLTKRHLSHLYARKGKGPLEKVPREQIRYWDNDTLSRSLLDRFYKLEIGHRVGAASVQQIFGVEMLGETAVSITRSSQNTIFTEALERHLRERQVYILALRYMELSDLDKRKETALALRNLFGTIKLVHACEYECEGERYSMSEGDLLHTDNEYFICTGSPNLEDALNKPGFCMSVSEMLCIQFKLTGPRSAGEIRNAIKMTEDEIDAYRATDIPDDVWRSASEALGLGLEEKRIWEARLARPLSADEESSLAFLGSRRETIRNLTGMELPDDVPTGIPLGDMDNAQTDAFVRWLQIPADALGERTADKLRELRRTRFKDFQLDGAIAGFVATELHRQFETKPTEEQRSYIPSLLRFQKDSDWYSDKLEKLMVENPLAGDAALWGVLRDSTQREFAVQLPKTAEDCEGSSKPDAGITYLNILNEAGIELDGVDAPELSLAFFTGNEEAFRKIVERVRRLEDEPIAPEQDETVPAGQTISIQRVSSVEELPSSIFWPRRESSVPSRHSRKVTHYQSDKRKRQIGKRAEEMVWKAINSDSGTYRYPQAWSSLLNKKGDANDSLHYDISYKTPEGEDRYIEVKAFDGHSFFMSIGEYKFANDKENRDKYILALVDDDKIHFIEAPFAPGSPFKEVLRIEVNDYTGHFERLATPSSLSDAVP